MTILAIHRQEDSPGGWVDHRTGIADRDQDLIPQFIDEGRLHVDIVPFPVALWRTMPALIDDDLTLFGGRADWETDPQLTPDATGVKRVARAQRPCKTRLVMTRAISSRAS